MDIQLRRILEGQKIILDNQVMLLREAKRQYNPKSSVANRLHVGKFTKSITETEGHVEDITRWLTD